MPFASTHNPFRDDISSFVDRVMLEAGLSRLPLEERAGIAEALAEEAHARVGLELLEAVDQYSLKEFRELVDEGGADDEIAAFFRVRVPDAAQRAAHALAALKDECVRIAADAALV